MVLKLVSRKGDHTMTEELSRTSALASRHSALGSGLEDWNGMGTAWSYDSNPNDEHDAVREKVGMFDMSPLKKVFVRGNAAMKTLNHLVTRDLEKLKAGRSVYTSVLTEDGTMADDAIVSCNNHQEWMIVHGSGDTMALLQDSAKGTGLDIVLDDDLHDLSVQGPMALGILNQFCTTNLAELNYFDHCTTELFGHSCRVSRTGYSGERGYEVFADSDAIVGIWDLLIDEGVMPCSFTALDKLRIEAGLLFYGYDMTTDHTPYEVGLGFTISPTKTGYRGYDALLASKGREKIRIVCLVVDYPEMLNGGETIMLDGSEIGIVNSPCYSRRMNKSLALGHVAASVPDGKCVQIIADGINTLADIVPLPIYDPKKVKTHS